MELVDLKRAEEFSPQHHVHKSLTATSHSDISIACWEPGQQSPIHRHPGADENRRRAGRLEPAPP